MKRFPHITFFTGALMILSGCVHAQTVQNITPHNSQPVMSVVTDHDPTGACTNYAQIYVNWKTGAQTACVNGQYQTSAVGGGGGMIYPSAGVPVSSGSGWSSSLTAPSGAIVGTTDAQTLTNKTVDGVSPTTFGYLDPTSSVQTQLNGKQGKLTLTTSGSSGAATLTGDTLNIPQYTGGGTSGAVYPFEASAASNVLKVGTDCGAAPCRTRVGSTTYSYNFESDATANAGASDLVFAYIDAVNPTGITFGSANGSVTCSTTGTGNGCWAVSGISNFPPESIPLYRWVLSNGTFAGSADFDARANQYTSILTGSGCVVVTKTATGRTVSLDTTNPSCATGGGGSTFNGGTITAPLSISTDGVTNSPLLKLLISNSTGYNVLELDDNLNNAWQIGVGGSATVSPYASAMYFYDKKNSRAFFAVDPATDETIFSSSASTPMQLNGGGQYGSGLTFQNTYSATTRKAFIGVSQADGALELGLDLTNGSTYAFHMHSNGLIATTSTGGVEWSSDPTNSSNGTIDTSLIRVSAGVVGVKNSAGNPGTLNAGTFSASGVTGFTGTKTAGTCVLTISGGIITNVTGC